MDHIKVLKRAFETTWRYRALWIFGIILALATASGGGRGGGGGAGAGGNGGPPLPGDLTMPEIPVPIMSTLALVGVSLICGVTIILAVVTTVARYVAETALIWMVDDHEKTGEQRSVREGFRLGWSRAAFRIFLINLLTGLPVTVVFILLFLLAFVPLLLWVTESRVAGIIGTVAAIGLFFLVLFLAIIVGIVLSLLRQFFWRACALEKLGVIESIRHGFYFVQRHLKDVVIMGLIMVGVQIGWAIALFIATILLLPVIILLIIMAAVSGGLPALLVGGLLSLFLEGALPWILGAVVGLPIFILILILVIAAPSLFVNGLMEVFKSSTWTLTYRELCALEGLESESEQPPELDEPDLTDFGE